MSAVCDSPQPWNSWPRRFSLISENRVERYRKQEREVVPPPSDGQPQLFDEKHPVASSTPDIHDGNAENNLPLDNLLSIPDVPIPYPSCSAQDTPFILESRLKSCSTAQREPPVQTGDSDSRLAPLSILTSSSPSSSLPSQIPRFPDPSAHLPPLPMLKVTSANQYRRSNKLRKSRRPSTSPPPRLAPLSFVGHPLLDLDFDGISHDAPNNLSHRRQEQALTLSPSQQFPSTEDCAQTSPSSYTRPRKLTKPRRPSILSVPLAQSFSSPEAAAATAVAGNSSQHHATPPSVSSPVINGVSHRAQSEIGHGGTRPSLSITHSSIMRHLSMRNVKSHSSPTASRPSGSQGNPSPISRTISRLTRWRASASDTGHQSNVRRAEETGFLPLVRVISPFLPEMPNQEREKIEHSRADTLQFGPINSGDINFTSSPQVYKSVDSDSPNLSSNPLRPPPKFTLEEDDSEVEMSNVSSATATPTDLSPYSRSAPPSRIQSTHLWPERVSTANRPPRRRWTFAMAMTDEDITDEAFIEQLERMRIQKELIETVNDDEEVWDAEQELFRPKLSHQTSPGSSLSQQQQQHSAQNVQDLYRSRDQAEISYTPSLPSFPHQYRTMDSPDATPPQDWQTTRRALLTCRELMRTERHYLFSLRALLTAETETTPPPLMLRYASQLVRVSELYLTHMEDNPNAWGVAEAFIIAEEALDSAFVGWCGVVGIWFDEHRDQMKRGMGKHAAPKRSSTIMVLRKSSSKNKLLDDFSEKTEKDKGDFGPLKRTVDTWRRSMSSISERSTRGTLKKKSARSPLSSMSETKVPNSKTSKRKLPPVRDLAILPTQRIMRYVMLYQDLFAHTPSTSPSRALVKRAADAAVRIAQKCDRAQTNSAFIIDKTGLQR